MCSGILVTPRPWSRALETPRRRVASGGGGGGGDDDDDVNSKVVMILNSKGWEGGDKANIHYTSSLLANTGKHWQYWQVSVSVCTSNY